MADKDLNMGKHLSPIACKEEMKHYVGSKQHIITGTKQYRCEMYC